MSKQEKKIKIYCTLCKSPVMLLPDEFRNGKNLDKYLLQAGTMTAVQMGTLCDSCLSKPLEKRILKK